VKKEKMMKRYEAVGDGHVWCSIEIALGMAKDSNEAIAFVFNGTNPEVIVYPDDKPQTIYFLWKISLAIKTVLPEEVTAILRKDESEKLLLFLATWVEAAKDAWQRECGEPQVPADYINAFAWALQNMSMHADYNRHALAAEAVQILPKIWEQGIWIKQWYEKNYKQSNG
jgi:hypothetical protein